MAESIIQVEMLNERIFDSWNGFLNSNFLMTLTTFLVGSFVIYLYYRQQRDQIKAAASIILLDIDDLEFGINTLKSIIEKNNIPTPQDLNLIRDSSIINWNNQKHLFVKRRFVKKVLESHHFSTINIFFKSAELLQTEIKRYQTLLDTQIYTKANKIQENLLTMLSEIKDENDIAGINKYNTDKAIFIKLTNEENYAFSSFSITGGFKNALIAIRLISDLPCVEKLRKIAKKYK